MWYITCLAEGCRESLAPSGRSDRPEYDVAGRVYARTGSSPHFVVAKARTLPWPSLAAFYWERSSCITGLTGAQLRSTRFPHSFRFPSASSSRHLSSFLCQTVPIWYRLPSFVISSTSLSFFDQQFDATLSLICSPMVYLSYFLSFLW